MNNFTEAVGSGFQSFMSFLPTLLGAILLLIVAWIVAKLVKKGVAKLLDSVGFDDILVKWGAADSQERAGQTIDAIAGILYFLVWLLFLPAILGMLGLTSVSEPISSMFTTALNYVPNVIGAALIFAIGYVIANFVKSLIYNLSLSIDVDKWMNKVSSSNKDEKPVSTEKQDTLAKVLSNLVFIVVLIPIATAALDTLGIKSISEPIVGVLDQIMSAIPNILVAVILLGIGIMIAKFVGDLITGLLQGTGINRVMNYIPSQSNMSIDLGKIIGQIVAVVIGVFFLVEALNVLNLEVLNGIGTAIISYLPLVISALVILGFGVIGGSALGSFIGKSANSEKLGEFVKYILIIFSVFMALDQLQFATTIVNSAFLFIMGGFAVAFALAFGLGGRDVAKDILQKGKQETEKELSNKDNNKSNNSQF